MKAASRLARFLCVFAVLALAACGGGGSGGGTPTDSGNGGNGGNGGNSPSAGQCEGTGSVTVSGRATYEFVPAVHPLGSSAFLDFENSEARPIRGAEVRAVCPDGSVTYASTATGENGSYTLNVPENVDVEIRILAAAVKSGTPSWNLQVVDNTENQGVWTLAGERFDSETGSLTLNLHAASGWTGSSYTESRAAAPFAILDSMYVAMQKVLAADAGAQFPALKVNWSPSNRGCSSDQSDFPFADGCIGTSFYANFGDAGRNIFVLGDAANDTDEFDNHVLIHEWGHYYEDAFSRSDSIGGQHTTDSRLDIRVAFGEGWGNAWSAIATDDVLYVDTFGTDAGGFSFDVENASDGLYPGWWNEVSIQEIIYDLYDAGNELGDPLTLGFDDLHAVLTGAQRSTSAMTSLFPFVHFLKGRSDDDTDLLIEQVVASHEISPIADEWGTGRGTLFSDEGPADDPQFDQYASPVHRDISLDLGMGDIEVCGSNHFSDTIEGSTYEFNRIGARRFLRFEVPSDGSWQVTLDGTTHADGLGTSGDPDFYIRLNGDLIAAADSDSSGSGIESATVNLVAGQVYSMEVLDWNNADDDPATGEDRVCHNLSFTLN